MTRQPKREGFRRRRKRYVVNTGRLVLCLLSLILIGEVILVCFTSPAFSIEHKMVVGNEIVSSDAVIRNLDLPRETNIFLIRKGVLAKRILRDPVVKEVSLDRDLPDVLVIRIVERAADLILDAGGILYEVDAEGVPFRVIEATDGVPTVISCKVSKVALGRRLVDRGFGAARECLLLAREKNFYRIAKITVDQNRELCLNVRDGFQVKLGRPERLSEKLEIARQAVEQVPKFRQDGIYVDVTVPEASAVKIEH